MSLYEEQAKKFKEDGYAVFENFLSDEEVENLRQAMDGLVTEMKPEEHHTIFSTTNMLHANDYFMASADKIGFFFEDGALDDKGVLKVPKNQSLNKVGHALHTLNPAFRKVTFAEKSKSVLKSVGFQDPVVAQSMYIFKQPHIGGEVKCHQDATYLYTEPVRVMGMWYALEDATLENGCLWFMPGSHKDGVHGNYRSVRNPDGDNKDTVKYTGDKPEYDQDQFVPVPAKKGTMAILDGLVVHKSEKNLSDKSRHIYVIHLYDAAVAKWSKQNWLQPTSAKTFEHIYDVNV